MFENSFLAMFISQVSSRLRVKHCQITRISTLPKRNFQTLFYGSVHRVSHYTSVSVPKRHFEIKPTFSYATIFLWKSYFIEIVKTLINFVPSDLKLHNRYWHNVHWTERHGTYFANQSGFYNQNQVTFFSIERNHGLRTHNG